jgi:ClpP class serine protease
MMALAADEVIMDENAVLGPVDPQIGRWPAASILSAANAKSIDQVEDETLILADIARKAITQVRWNMRRLLEPRLDSEEANRIATALAEGRWTHDYPLMVEELRELGVPVTTELPTEIYDFMELFPQPGNRRPSVQYIPLPYDSEGDAGANGRTRVGR